MATAKWGDDSKFTPETNLLGNDQVMAIRNIGAGSFENIKIAGSAFTSAGSPISFNAGLGTAKTIPNGGISDTLVGFDTIQFNIGNSYSATTFQCLPNTTGSFLFFTNLEFAVPGAAATVRIRILKNGNSLSPIAQRTIDLPNSGDPVSIPLAANVQLLSNTDYITVVAYLTGNAGNSLDLIGSPYHTYFGGFLCAQTAADIQSVTQLRTVKFATTGSDADGDGTVDFPLASFNAAVAKALTLLPTTANPVCVSGDPGTYQVTNGAVLYPNLIFDLKGVTLTTDGIVNSITYAPNSSWTTTASKIYFDGGVLDSTLALNLDTTGFTNFKNTLHLRNFNSVGNTIFKFGSSTHQGSINLDGNVQLASGIGSGVTIDSVFVIGNPGHQLALTGAVSLLATHNITSFQSYGNTGLGLVQITSSATRSINFQGEFGNQISFSIDATQAGSVSLALDNTTLPPALNGMITGTNYSFINTSANGYFSQSTLTDGASVPWDIALSPFAIWVLGGNSHTLNPFNLFSDAIATITIQQDGTGGWTPNFNSNMQFPLGAPGINTAANAETTLQFICVDATNLICISPPALAQTVTGTPPTLQWGTTYNINSTSLTTLTMPASPFPIGAKPIRICGLNTGGWVLQNLAGQTGIGTAGGVAGVNQTTTGTGGSISSSDPYDRIDFVPQNSNTYVVIDSKGNVNFN